MQNIELAKGEIHSLMWRPNTKEFIVICGFMPAYSVLFGSDQAPLFQFGRNHRNKIMFNPFNRYLLLAGFGNLGGDIELWDMNTHKSIGKCNSHSASFCTWAPDGKHFLTAVCSPFIVVDNDYKIFDLVGNLICHIKLGNEAVYEVQWRPGKFYNSNIHQKGKYTKEPTPPKV